MTHPGKLALDAMVETAGKALVPMTHRCPAQDDCAACNVTYDHYAAAYPTAVQSVADYVAELEEQVEAVGVLLQEVVKTAGRAEFRNAELEAQVAEARWLLQTADECLHHDHPSKLIAQWLKETGPKGDA